MPYGPINREYPYERKVTHQFDDVASPPDYQEEPATIQELHDVAEQVKAKAQEFVEFAKQNAANRIPVDGAYKEVVASVRRLDPTSQGQYITLDLAESIVRGKYDQYKGVDIEGVMNAVSGMPVPDARRMKHAINGGRPGKMEKNSQLEDALYTASELGLQISHLFVAQQMNNLFDSPDKAATTVTPNLGKVAAQIASAWALILGFQVVGQGALDQVFGRETDASRSLHSKLEELGVPELGDQIEQVLFGTVDKQPDRALGNLLRDQDDDLVMRYIDEYLANHPEQDLAPWRFALDGIRSEYAADAYSENSSMEHLAKFRQRMAHTGVAASALFSMPYDMVRAGLCDLAHMSHLMDAYTRIMSSEYTRDVICCIVRWAGKVGEEIPSALRSVRDVLVFGRNILRFDMSSLVDTLSISVNDYLSRRVYLVALELFQSMWQGLINPVLDWFDQDEDKWAVVLEKCFGIKDLLNFVLAQIEIIEAKFQQYLEEMLAATRIDRANASLKIGAYAEERWSTSFINLIDAVLAAIQSGNLCAENEYPSPEQALNLIENYLPNVDTSNLTGTGPRYRRFNPVSVQTSWGAELPAPTPTDRGSEDVGDSATLDCMQRLSGTEAVILKRSASHIQSQLDQLRHQYGAQFDDE